MDKHILPSSKIHHYADIPIPDFVDMIMKGDDEAMYYLLHNRLNRRLYERYNDYRQKLYDDFEDIIEDFFLYLREHGRYPYQSLRRIKNRDAFETWLLNTFRNYLSNRAKRKANYTSPTATQTTSPQRRSSRSLPTSNNLPLPPS